MSEYDCNYPGCDREIRFPYCLRAKNLCHECFVLFLKEIVGNGNNDAPRLKHPVQSGIDALASPVSGRF